MSSKESKGDNNNNNNSNSSPLPSTPPKVRMIPRTPGSAEKIQSLQDTAQVFSAMGIHTGDSRGIGWTAERKGLVNKELRGAKEQIETLELECEALHDELEKALKAKNKAEEENKHLRAVIKAVQALTILDELDEKSTKKEKDDN